MLEVAMCVCLTLMGIYFFKSTDLPKDLKERQVQNQSNYSKEFSPNFKKMSFDTIKIATINEDESDESDSDDDNTIEEETKDLLHGQHQLEIQKKLISEEVSKINLTIVALQNEIKINNYKNTKIQKEIESYFSQINSLKEKVIS